MKKSAPGFSLLELIVVLALVGLVLVLALPNLGRLYEGFTRETEQDRLLSQLAGVGRQAMLRGRAYAVYGTGDNTEEDKLVSGYDPYELDVPSGWRVDLDRPLLVRANGVCMGATVRLLHQNGLAVRAVLRAPYCRVEIAS